MPPHATGSGTLSFGLVSIPVKMYTATSSETVAFNQLHEKCGSRIRQQIHCPVCNETVERSSLVKAYEFAKDQYVRLTEEELKAIEGEASKSIDILEFVPLAEVDPIYFEKTYYLGPDKGGDKAYRLLSDAMVKTGRVALAKVVMRGKESLVLIRPAGDGLMLHSMYFADEVRDFNEVGKGQGSTIKAGELALAERLIEELSSEHFNPGQYHDEYRGRVLSMIEAKIEGKEITSLGPEVQRTQVIDLMDALKQSLEKRTGKETRSTTAVAGAGARRAEEPAARKPATKAKRAAAAEAPEPRAKKTGTRG